MKKAVAISLMSIWIAFGFYSWGTSMAELDYNGKHKYAILRETPRDYVGECAFYAITGPFSAFVLAITTNFNQHGWEMWPEGSK